MHSDLHLTSLMVLAALVATWFGGHEITYADALVPVESREYKMRLSPEHFKGNDPAAAVKAFWTALDQELGAEFEIKGRSEAEPVRQVGYYDTPGTCVLRANGYILRQRSSENKTELVLKFRSPDRYIAMSRNVKSEEFGAETTFEEDIQPGFTSVFSHTGTFNLNEMARPKKLINLSTLFKGLSKEQLDKDEELSLVNALNIMAKRFKTKKIMIGKKKSRFTLTLWYLTSSSIEPDLAEVSFRYRDDKEDYSRETVEAAKRIFDHLQTMEGWKEKGRETKTSWVYTNRGSAFCHP